MNPTVPHNARTLPNGKGLLVAEQLLVGNLRVIHLVKEIEDFLRDILTLEVIGVHIFAFIIMGLLRCFQQSRSQLGVCHAHGFHIVQTCEFSDMDFVLEVILPKLHQPLCRVNIVHTILGSFFQLRFGQCPVDVKGYGGLLNR